MILQALRDYIQQNPGCTLANISTHFGMSEDACMAMLNNWVKRGKLKIKRIESCSSGSCNCEAMNEQIVLHWAQTSEIGVSSL